VPCVRAGEVGSSAAGKRRSEALAHTLGPVEGSLGQTDDKGFIPGRDSAAELSLSSTGLVASLYCVDNSF